MDYLREIEPDFLRVGGRSVKGLHQHQDEFELLLMLSRFAARHDMRLIASDCREKGEMLALKRAGVALRARRLPGGLRSGTRASGVAASLI